MSLEPLLTAEPVVIFHALAALIAFLLGVVQLAGPKGTTTHRIIGWSWVLLLMSVATSSFWLQDIRQFGPFSWIHGLSIFTLVMLSVAVYHARRHNIGAHKAAMTGMFFDALVIAGLFTLLPGRNMHAVVFGAT